ncbi:response regulator transcription factor [Cytophaga aurantiaca]|uniref:response regulator transcription factor n=1 Tax=Cytophaga aurantiaca TaxID=29530 RepID=UPI000364D009|nr:helix-turn-helix transcriptional regulator [Cytophaga aurantiaca]
MQQFLFLLLSILVLFYNTLHGIFSNQAIHLPIELQKSLIGLSYILLSIYLPVYFLKAFNLNPIKFFAYWGGLLFFLTPYVLFNIMPIYLVNYFKFHKEFQIVAPIIYGFSMLYFYITSLFKEHSNLISLFSKVEIATIFVSLMIWSLLPILIYFDLSTLLENFIVNSCFVLLIVILLKKNTSVSKKKYEDMLAALSDGKDNHFIDTFNFTSREKEIIPYLVKGYTYKEIGEVLFISDRTVGKHVSNMYAKTGVNQKYDLFEKLNIINF